MIYCWDIRGNYATKSTVAECVKRLCLGCVDELLAAFLEFPGVDGEAGKWGRGAVVRSKVPIQDVLHIMVEIDFFINLFKLMSGLP